MIQAVCVRSYREDVVRPVAICVRCGAATRIPVEMSEGSTGSFTNVGTNCLRCGGEAKVPDGTFQVVGGVMQWLAEASLADVQKVADILDVARSEGAAPDDVRSRLIGGGELGRRLVELLPEGPRFWGVVATLIALLAIWVQHHDAGVARADSANEAEVMRALAEQERLTNEVLERLNQEATTATVPRPPDVHREPKVGRNAPCPCGSGQKHKYCHGR